jgi:cold shock CspA family protein
MSDELNGTITSIKKDRGFGFIRTDDHVDRFFHANGCVTPFETLQEGQRVGFEPFTLPGARGEGLRARRVHLQEGE